ncbi:Helix-turn-helix domain-containing protein [Natronincola peptidivorans]|uniref:Stage 0 sporulation protein A homolog n=1 Tax=Natronincola peptidivorans TaxID=426128 RepID=A0A1I0G5L1_9FIRM|nr:response regulator [Natronincola peptidivorans]SET66036.1 Helix-turn-helix domain-containing protein [Natronincola peptidivorans]
MLKVLIVEDENFERKALKYLINKHFLRKAFIVGEASNGKEAINQALILSPDIVFMDINMPLMDGLQASERIKEINKDIEIIILSAYGEFDYAKKAIKCGVSDYLVKPFTNQDFILALNKVIDKLHAKKNLHIKHKNINESFNKARPFIEKDILIKILYSKFSDYDEIEESIKLLDINSTKGSCIIIGNRGTGVFCKDSLNIAKKIFKNLFSNVIGAMLLGDIVLFVFDDDIENTILSRKMAEVLNVVKASFNEANKIDIDITVGYIADQAKDYSNSYSKARLTLRDNYKKANRLGNIDNLEEIELCDQQHIISEKIINEDLGGALKTGEELLNQIIDSSKDASFDCIKSAVTKSITEIRTNILNFTEYDENESMDDHLETEIESLLNVNDIENYFKLYIKRLIQTVDDYKNTNNINIVANAKRYIDKNYMKDIRLEDVAKEVCISSYYFSRTFKKYEGINYIQYLTKVRMEKAKSLIIEGRISIKEISIKVGFFDQNYFSRAFKKYTKQSPKEFANKYKKSKLKGII